jgi:hypothetical protein
MAKKQKEQIIGCRLRDTSTGLYLSKITDFNIVWSKRGKIWRSKGYLASYIKRAIAGSSSIPSEKKIREQIMNNIGNWDICEIVDGNVYSIAFIINKIQ